MTPATKPIVLLVDDDGHLLHGLVRALRRQPFQLYTARSGEEAVAAIKAHPVDVLVTDHRMPGISGNDLLAWAAQHAPDIMRIVLTGHATTDGVIRAVNEGRVFQYFTKPCREVDLALAIHKAAEYRALARENQRLTDEGRRWRAQRREIRRRLARLERWCHAGAPEHRTTPETGRGALIEEARQIIEETRRIVAELGDALQPPPASPAPGQTAVGR